MKKQKIKQDGITLIALVITIIILLILAGVTISLVLGNNGILNRATDAVVVSKIKEAEEFARMSYMERKIDEIVDGKEATIAGVISDLKEKGYTIKQDAGSGNSIIGIAVSEEKVAMERNASKTITYTLVYSGGIRYFVQIQGEYYEINFSNENIAISTEPAELNTTVKEPEVTVESNDSSIIEVSKIEEGKLLLTAKDKLGEVEITVKEINSAVTKKFTATTQIAVASISITPTEKTIGVGETANLTLAVEPSNAVNKEVTWNSSDINVATVSESGVVNALSIGTTTITAKATDGSNIVSNECTITVVESVLLDRVNEKQSTYYGKKVEGYEANEISDWRIFYADDENVFLITTDYVPSSKVVKCNNTMTAKGNYVVYWSTVPTVADTVKADKFSPVTAETMKWIGNYGTNDGGKCVSTLLDTSKWTSFVNDKYATMAIGSPTLNMWVASWNTKYPSEKLYCNNSNEKGYFVGTESNPTSYNIVGAIMNQMVGYGVDELDNMYYPHKGGVDGCGGYRISASSGVVGDDYSDISLMLISCNGTLGARPYNDDDGWSMRPVICLKSDVEIIGVSDSTVTLK